MLTCIEVNLQQALDDLKSFRIFCGRYLLFNREKIGKRNYNRYITEGDNVMIEEFEVKKEIFERLPHGLIHFEISLDGRNYEGHYRNGDVNWFHPQPEQENHDMPIDEVEEKVHQIIIKYIH